MRNLRVGCFRFVYSPTYETGGELFPPLYDYLLTGLNFSNATMIGYCIIKEAWAQIILILLLFPVIAIFRGRVREYDKSSRVIGLTGATAVDQESASAIVMIEPREVPEGGTETTDETLVTTSTKKVIRERTFDNIDDDMFRQPALRAELTFIAAKDNRAGPARHLVGSFDSKISFEIDNPPPNGEVE